VRHDIKKKIELCRQLRQGASRFKDQFTVCY
jgi:hypothetical protein